MADRAPALLALELSLLLEALHQRHGVDLRDCHAEHLMPVLDGLMHSRGIGTLSALQERVLHEPGIARDLLGALGLLKTSLFEQPACLHVLHTEALPRLRSYPAPRIWLADAVSAEDVLALAALLHEHGLRARADIYVTSREEAVLRDLRSATLSAPRLALGRQACREAGMVTDLRACVHLHEQTASVVSAADITYGQHCLLGDASFNEFDLILCRHPLPTLEQGGQRRVLGLFADSLPMLGMVCLAGPVAQRRMPRFAALGSSALLYRRTA